MYGARFLGSGLFANSFRTRCNQKYLLNQARTRHFLSAVHTKLRRTTWLANRETWTTSTWSAKLNLRSKARVAIPWCKKLRFSTSAAVLPLIKRDGLPEVAKQIVEDLKWDFNVAYDEKDAVGRRYRRQDANGTPFCITVDHDTLEDQTVTIRHRDSMAQERVKIDDLKTLIKKETDVKSWFE